MNLSSLRPAEGARKTRKRRGRGPGSGLGKTAGRGHKGQLAGAGYSQKRGFEGGQMPLVRRIPKRGFTNIFRQEYAEVNLDGLARVGKAEIGPKDMTEAGLIKNESERVKVLGRGDVTAALTVHAHKFSGSAVKKLEAKGGRAVLIGKD
ncbi:MAG: 50S ribosomal protein L15 [Candidatus Aminicenantes bacterium]|nr:50S ribosomal protein L15 [Candidatus Aminicenantes bacterium]